MLSRLSRHSRQCARSDEPVSWVEKVRPEIPGLNTADGNSKFGQFHRHCFAEAADRPFRGGVETTAGEARPSTNAGEVCDHARSLIAEVGEEGASNVEQTKHIGVKLFLCFLGTEIAISLMLECLRGLLTSTPPALPA